MRWRWYGYVPREGLVLVDGDPEAGKSTLLLSIAALITRGGSIVPSLLVNLEKPSMKHQEPRGVLYLYQEDSAQYTIMPRFVAAGGNRNLIWLEPSPDQLPNMADRIESAIIEHDAAMVVLDPLMAYIRSTSKETEVRASLGLLRRIAEKNRCVIFLIRHWTKSARGSALFAGSGSLAFTADTRVQLSVGKSPDEPDTRVLAVSKNNLVPEWDRPSLRFAFDDQNGVSVVRWIGECAITADDLIAVRRKGRGPPPTRRVAAEEVLADILAAGPVKEEEVVKRAAAARVSERTLKRAKEHIGARSLRRVIDGDAAWWWSLPVSDMQGGQVGQEPGVQPGPLGLLTEGELEKPKK